MGRHADIRGMAIMTSTPQDLDAIHSALITGLENGTLRPVIGKERPLAQAAQAHLEIIEPGAYGKIVFIP